MAVTKVSKLRVFWSVLLLSQALGSFRAAGFGAQPPGVPQGPSEERVNTGSISGRVTSDSGRPIAGARVTVRQTGGLAGAGMHRTRTDQDGRFEVEDLPEGSYAINASSPGYFMSKRPEDSPGAGAYRLGESANIVLVKGGVITGKVTGGGAAPVVAVNVRAIKVRDPDGKAVTNMFSAERQTDDRGVFRVYGLEPGSYVVEAGGGGRSSVNQNNRQVRTFYPSETRNTAREIRVEAGGEVGGIDITVRNGTGHSVSGNIAAGPTAVKFSPVSLRLFDSTTGLLVYDASLQMDDRNNGFAIYGLPDGRYDLVALSTSSIPGSFAVRRIKVEGADMADMNMELKPLGSATGRARVEPLSPGSEYATCKTPQGLPAGQIIVKAELDGAGAGRGSLPFADAVSARVDGEGEFRLANLRDGSYRITVEPADDGLYLKSAVIPAGGVGTTPNRAPVGRPRDVANDGLLIEPGDVVRDIVLTLAPGAAQLRGRLTLSGDAPRPSSVRLHLIPAEPEYADAPSRYAEATVEEDGTFVLNNITPGRYLVVTAAAADDGKSGSPRPAAWDFKGRAELRRLAEADKKPVELRPCERRADFNLQYRQLPRLSIGTNR